MIGKVMRGRRVDGLLRYLYGAGKANEHTDPHLVAGWDPHLATLEPALLPDGRRDVRRLSGLLSQPVAASARPPQRPVWHCAVRTAPGDRRLSDAEWAEVARDIVRRTGLAPDGDDGGCRWVAVRHADDHIHLVVTLARQDGRPARTSNDFYRVGEACRAAEDRLGLRRTAPRDRTAGRTASRAEHEKAARAARPEPVRATLQREVRTAAAGAATPQDFLARLQEAGLLVRPRHSDRDPGQVTGYAVALPGDRDAAGQPIWFGGGKLAADLSWPKLATRWPTARTGAAPGVRSAATAATASVAAGRRRVSGHARNEAWRVAVTLSEAATAGIHRLAVSDPALAGDLAAAAADLLAATARVTEGRKSGHLTQAADRYARAARDLYGRTPPRTHVGHQLRGAAQALSLLGRTSRDEVTQVLALLAALTSLSDAVAGLREAQHRTAQAAAARDSADLLRAARQQLAPAGQAAGRGVVHSHPAAPAVHRTTRTTPAQIATPRR